MPTGFLRRLAIACIMAAVLFMGAAATAVHSPVAIQDTSAGSEPVIAPTPIEAPQATSEPVAATPEPTKTPDVPVPSPLPWITAEVVLPSAPADPADPGTPYSGILVAAKTDGLVVHESPDGAAIGMLPARVIDSEGSDRTWMPVIGSADGPWLQVLLPARRNLPSSGAPVNGAVGWVLASDVLTKPSAVTVDVDLASGTITVADGATVLDVFPVSISGGDATARGRSFVMGRYSTEISQYCSAQPMLVLSAQSENVDGYLDQTTAVQAIHGFSDHCKEISGYTQATPGCIIASEEDIGRLLEIVPDGTPVTVHG